MQYYVLMEKGRYDSDLWNWTKRPQEPLQKHISKFKEILAKIPRISQAAALLAQWNGLRHKLRFKEELTVNYPATFKMLYFE